jgi:hypothetical protein
MLVNVLCLTLSRSARVIVEASLQLPHTYPDCSAPTSGCSCLSVWKDVLCLVPSHTARGLIDVFLPSAHTCPADPANRLDCSCSSMCEDALYPALSRSARVLVKVSLSPARTCLETSFPELGTQPPIPTMRPHRIEPNV